MQINTKVIPFILNALLCDHCWALNLISVSFLSCLLVVTEPVTIYSRVYLKDLRQLNSQFYIPGLLLQLKLRKNLSVLLNVQTNFITGKLLSIILDTVFGIWLYQTPLSFC